MSSEKLYHLSKETRMSEDALIYIASRHPYQNPINERHVCKNNYLLTRVFHLLVGQLFFANVSHTY